MVVVVVIVVITTVMAVVVVEEEEDKDEIKSTWENIWIWAPAIESTSLWV